MSPIYQPLDIKQTQIRHLTLLAGVNGRFDDPLQGEVHVVSLDDSADYEALSYVWGDPDPPESMFLNGQLISITPNLDCALRHLRQPKRNRILWVDQLCINQEDLDERGSQVKLMRRVYQTASSVLVWLGPGTADTTAAMQSIERFDKPYWQTYDFQVQFMEILSRPWFTRIWVVQEFLLGKNPRESPLVGCGDIWVLWIPFIAAWAHYNDNLPVIQAEYLKHFRQTLSPTFELSWIEQAAHQPIRSVTIAEESIVTGLREAFGPEFLQQAGHDTMHGLLEHIRANPAQWRARQEVIQHCSYDAPVAKAYWRWMELTQVIPLKYHEFLLGARGDLILRQKPLTFEGIFTQTMNLRCKDPRDKIYGMLGLVSEEARKSIPVDYHKEPPWTYVPAMAHIIRNESKGLLLISRLWRTRHFKNPIPSWVADFTVSANPSDEHNPVFLRGSCITASWSWEQETVVSTDLTTLSASGLSFGEVTHVVSFVDGSRDYFVQRFREIETLVGEHCPRGQEPLWRTLVGIRNQDPDVCKPYPYFWEVLMERAEDSAGIEQKHFQDCVLQTARNRKFFVTDKGFAGVATPMIREGDTIALIIGMVRAAVLRQVDPEEVGIVIKEIPEKPRSFKRITAFAYVGCHDRPEFEDLVKEGPENWKKHACLSQTMETFHII